MMPAVWWEPTSLIVWVTHQPCVTLWPLDPWQVWKKLFDESYRHVAVCFNVDLYWYCLRDRPVHLSRVVHVVGVVVVQVGLAFHGRLDAVWPTGWPVSPWETVRVSVTEYWPERTCWGVVAAEAMPPAKASVPAVAPAIAVSRIRLRMNS